MFAVSSPDLPVITIPQPSVLEGERLVVVAEGLDVPLNLTVCSAGEYENQWCLMAQLEPDADDPSSFILPQVAGLPCGTYVITRGTATRDPDAPNEVTHYPLQIIFEVRGQDEAEKDVQALRERYAALCARRESLASQTLGSDPKSIAAVVFVRDLMLTEQAIFDGFKVIPLDRMGWTTELQSIENAMQQYFGQAVPIPEEVSRQASLAGPAALLYFRDVRGETVDECINNALNEARKYCVLMSLQRGSLGQPFALVVSTNDEDSPGVGIALDVPRYAGNLLGGFISGEQHKANRAGLDVLGRNPTVLLYATLLGEALREARTDFMYVRLWSLLETIARSRNYVGQPLVDWSGLQQVSNTGMPMDIPDHAQKLVFELLRDLLTPMNFTDGSFAQNLSFGKLSEQTEIWYERRNCTAHGGECECKAAGTSTKLRKQKCAAARADQEGGPYGDPYLVALRECTRLVVGSLLR